MSRQIQIRRGTATENDNFIGAIGEITMDTTNKTLRVHDGETVGGTVLAKQSEIPDITNADYVIESQLPTAENNYTWYRKYKSGWVEQGGIDQFTSTSNRTETITLPITLTGNEYSIQMATFGSGGQGCMKVTAQTATDFTYVLGSAANTFKGTKLYWQVSGLSV